MVRRIESFRFQDKFHLYLEKEILEKKNYYRLSFNVQKKKLGGLT